ncbi:MAG: sugar ABC transporter substrate-binding protein [Burkholderiaceae bacterium]
MKLAVFTKNRSNPAYAGARHGADLAARLHGAETRHFVPATPDDPEQQSQLIDEALLWRPDAVILSPVHPTKVDPAILRIKAAGLPIVALVSPIKAVPCVSFVNSDDYSLAVEIARHLFRKMGNQGRILTVSGHKDSATSLERLRGFNDAAKEYPGIVLADTVVGDYVRSTAYANTTQWLADNPASHIDACLVANDIMALGVIDAFKEAGRQALIVGVNAIPEAVPALKSGALLATADFNAMRMAYLAAEVAVRHLKGEAVPRHIQLPVHIIESHNCQEYDRPYEERSVLTLEQVLAGAV